MELAARTPAPGDVLGRLALAPFTSAETMKLLEPIGIDRQTAELKSKVWHSRYPYLPNRRPLDFHLLGAKADAASAGSSRVALFRGSFRDHAAAKALPAV